MLNICNLRVVAHHVLLVITRRCRPQRRAGNCGKMSAVRRLFVAFQSPRSECLKNASTTHARRELSLSLEVFQILLQAYVHHSIREVIHMYEAAPLLYS